MLRTILPEQEIPLKYYDCRYAVLRQPLGFARGAELLDDDNVYNLLDSPCRNSTNMFSYYMTELNGINVIVKLIIIGLYLKKYKKKSIFINGLIIILAIHTFIHILIILDMNGHVH